MDEKTVIAGIRQFAKNIRVVLNQDSDVLFSAKFDGDEYTTLIAIEGLAPAIVVSYATLCGSLASPSVAPTLLLKNWGGVESTCFYFSVHVEDDHRPWLYLETRQLLQPDMTSDDIAGMLGSWRLHCLQAKQGTS